MASELVCPFCPSRVPEAEAGWNPVLRRNEWGEFYDCPCSAGAFSSRELQEAVEREDPEALQAVRESIGAADFVHLERRRSDITETDPPRRLLWARRGAPPPTG